MIPIHYIKTLLHLAEGDSILNRKDRHLMELMQMKREELEIIYLHKLLSAQIIYQLSMKLQADQKLPN